MVGVAVEAGGLGADPDGLLVPYVPGGKSTAVPVTFSLSPSARDRD
jgi:hypothetical protein